MNMKGFVAEQWLGLNFIHPIEKSCMLFSVDLTALFWIFFLMHSCLQIKDNLCETCDFRATVIFKFASSVVENIDITLNTLSSSLFMPFSFSVLLVQVIFTGFERCIAEPYCWTLAQWWRKIEFASACFTHSKFSPWGIRLICSQG